MKNQYITIEGNIGVGKTTFVKMLSQSLNCKMILEQFEDNPFLKQFYDQPDRYALSLELFFMSERFQQLSDSVQIDLFSEQVISDYFFMKSKLFAKNNLSEQEFLLFSRFADIALKNLAKPDILIYLHSSVSRLKENIDYRSRAYEKNISEKYLLDIQHLYFDYFKKKQDFPILILDVEHVDFVKDKHAYQKMLEIIQNTYSLGVHNFKI